MEILWTPWRSKYIETFKDENKKNNESCFFCEACQSIGMEKELLVVHRNNLSFAMLNKFPYNNGHLLIAPYRHIGEMQDISNDELFDMLLLLRDSTKVLQDVYNPQGFNIGVNLGRSAGAGVPQHFHFHIVPRWNGDTSFMAVLSDVKIVSQSLEDSQRLISDTFLRYSSGTNNS